MLANSQELYQWLEKGAYFCVCGDASRTAADVDRALHQVIEAAGNKSAEQAVEYVKQMKADNAILRTFTKRPQLINDHPNQHIVSLRAALAHGAHRDVAVPDPTAVVDRSVLSAPLAALKS